MGRPLFGFKIGVVPLQSHHKNLDLSYKMDLDLWDGLRRKTHLEAEYG